GLDVDRGLFLVARRARLERQRGLAAMDLDLVEAGLYRGVVLRALARHARLADMTHRARIVATRRRRLLVGRALLLGRISVRPTCLLGSLLAELGRIGRLRRRIAGRRRRLAVLRGLSRGVGCSLAEALDALVEDACRVLPLAGDVVD